MVLQDFDVLSALEPSCKEEGSAYGIILPKSCAVAPENAGEVIRSTVAAVDCQHDIADLSPKGCTSVNGRLTEIPNEADLIIMGQICYLQILGEDGDDQSPSAVSVTVIGADLSGDLQITAFGNGCLL